jgi:hypothetical protein
VTTSTSLGCGNDMRQFTLILLTLTLAACSIDSEYAVMGCDFRPSDGSDLNQRIGLAHAEMVRGRTTQSEFTYRLQSKRPSVVVVLPAEGIDRASVASLDLPREAKRWLELQIDGRAFEGPLLGVLEANRVEWHPLAEGVSAQQLLYAWKQPGEELTVQLTIAADQPFVASLR